MLGRLTGTMDDTTNAAIASGLLLAGAYAGLGLIFAVAFHTMGLKRLDHGADGAGWGFRLIITPGVVALWPVLLVLWLKRNPSENESIQLGSSVSQRTLRAWQRFVWFALVVLVPVGLALALAQRPPVQAPGMIPWSPSTSR